MSAERAGIEQILQNTGHTLSCQSSSRATMGCPLDIVATLAESAGYMGLLCRTALDTCLKLARPPISDAEVKPGVFCLGHQLQVSQSVVGAVAVDMVNMLVRLQRASDALLHDQTMFQNVPVLVGMRVLRQKDRNVAFVRNVAIPVVSSPLTIRARMRAVLSPSLSKVARVRVERVAAMFTGILGTHRDQSSRCRAGDVDSIARLSDVDLNYTAGGAPCR